MRYDPTPFSGCEVCGRDCGSRFRCRECEPEREGTSEAERLVERELVESETRAAADALLRTLGARP